jgi:hypothetical protein
MKTVRATIIFLTFSLIVSSCSVFGSNKRGCPGGGLGAEKMMDGSKAQKQKKFRG